MSNMLYLLLCAYNEERDIGNLLEDIKAGGWDFPYRVIIVDDGSSDATRQIPESFSRKLPVTLLSHGWNRGLGQALSTGFTFIGRELKDDDIVVTMDADRTHPAEDVPLLRAVILEGCDLVIASRYCAGGAQSGLSSLRRALSRAAGIIMAFACPTSGVRDYTSGFRAFSGSLLRRMAGSRKGEPFLREPGFAATLELLMIARRQTEKIREVPLRLHYEKKLGPSKMRVIRTILCYFRLIAREMMGL